MRVRELPNRIHNAIAFDESATVFNSVDSADSFFDNEGFGEGRTVPFDVTYLTTRARYCLGRYVRKTSSMLIVVAEHDTMLSERTAHVDVNKPLAVTTHR